ncbi:DNA polymerase theta [Carabus blaptoides fortunei]
MMSLTSFSVLGVCYNRCNNQHPCLLFQDRLQFGIQHDLLDLMKLSSLNGPRARTLHKAGIETLADLAACDNCKLENLLHSAVPFQSEKEREGESAYDVEEKKKMRGIWITGKQGLTAREAADIAINKEQLGQTQMKANNNKDEKNHENIEDDESIMNENIIEEDIDNVTSNNGKEELDQWK